MDNSKTIKRNYLRCFCEDYVKAMQEQADERRIQRIERDIEAMATSITFFDHMEAVPC